MQMTCPPLAVRNASLLSGSKCKTTTLPTQTWESTSAPLFIFLSFKTIIYYFEFLFFIPLLILSTSFIFEF